MGLLDGDLAQSIYDGFRGQLLSGTYSETVVPDSGALDERGDPLDVSSTPQDCEGFVERYSAFVRAQAGIPQTDVKVCLFARSMPGVTPKRNGVVAIGGKWYRIRERATDPAEALWELQSFEIEEPEA